MVSFIRASNHFVFSAHSIGNCPTFPSLASMIHPRRRLSASLDLTRAKETGFLGVSSFESRIESPVRGSGFVWRCKGWENEGDPALEAEIFEFMLKSKKPDFFPTKKELLDAGRMDLVEGIAKQGGWLSLGWDLDEEGPVQEDGFPGWNSILEKAVGNGFVRDDSRIFQQRFASIKNGDSLEGIEVGSSGVSPLSTSSSYPALSHDRSIEMEGGDDAGIEGILSRLEKERNLSFGFGLREKESSSSVWKNDNGDDWHPRIQKTPTVNGIERSSRSTSLSPSKDLFNDSGGMLIQNRSFSDFNGIRNSPEPEMWRTWSIQRAGFPDTEFEASEIVPSERRTEGVVDAINDRLFTVAECPNETEDIRKELNSGGKENDNNQIRSRLQRLDLELASVLRLLRSRTDEVGSRKVHESSFEDLHKLSDAWEFQETEIMNAQDNWRSTRAKLAVLEGKMALAVIEAQKLVEEKQKRVDDARKALSLLRTACIVWPNSASEVLLSGSFDGWDSQRKMERSSTGIFSLCLKLYPGRYEIKFIVDGVWRIDPIRPIVNNNGYRNNLIIIS
ncbi:hypothetical protein HHK36_024806 [Tetracentron sinense]|uniref:AMP-activated protein kinase glycogen-binding domain-containing protein n=1 Tax=Tetracentron sinense TaxID=13715 RepID=A0A834YNS2_TETSI|nr:hypothetical protein HHK36_024806 [Tetracentron sinense]